MQWTLKSWDFSNALANRPSKSNTQWPTTKIVKVLHLPTHVGFSSGVGDDETSLLVTVSRRHRSWACHSAGRCVSGGPKLDHCLSSSSFSSPESSPNPYVLTYDCRMTPMFCYQHRPTSNGQTIDFSKPAIHSLIRSCVLACRVKIRGRI